MRHRFALLLIGALLVAGQFHALPEPASYPTIEQFSPIRAAEGQGLNLGPAAPSADGKLYVSQYPNGDAPIPGCTTPSTWTETDIGDGFGEVCFDDPDWLFAVGGTTFRQNAHLIYKDAGAGDAQFSATVLNDYTGTDGNNAGLGIGLRETDLVDSFIFQIHSLNLASPQVQLTYGENGSYETIDASVGETRPTEFHVTYDVSTTTLKAFAGGLEVGSVVRNMSDVLAYAVGQSKSTTASLTATLQVPVLSSTIDVYAPDDPDPGSPPVLVSAIPNQSGAQGASFTLDFRPYFTGATSYSTTSFPGSSGLSEISDGVVGGTIAAADVSASPYSEDLCATNGDGTTCDTVQFTFTAPPGGGTVHTIGTGTHTINCNTLGGGVEGGDIIEFTSGDHGSSGSRVSSVSMSNCNGTTSAPILVRKSSSATRLRFFTSGQDGFKCENCTNIEIDFSYNWTGNAGACEPDPSDPEADPTGCGLLVDFSGQFCLKGRGKLQGVTWKGIECDGNWPGGNTAAGGDVGISPNDQSYCVSDSPSLLNREFRDRLTATQLFIHDVAKEAAYFGPNVNYGNCPSGQSTPRLRDITLSKLTIRRAGWDGVNCKSAFAGWGCIVEDSVITDIGTGTEASGANSVGIALFESAGIIRRNYVRRTTDPPGGAAGITCSANQAPSNWGTLDCQIYGNDVARTDGAGITLNRGPNADADRSGDIDYNTIVDTGGQCININGNVGGGGTINDNITSECGAGPADGITNNGFSKSGNLTCADENAAACDFDDPGNDDFRIGTSSNALNSGVTSCPATDIEGTVRPQGAGCDKGAHERVP